MVEYKISTKIIALVIFSLIIVGVSEFYMEIATNYGGSIKDLGNLDVSQEINTRAEQVKVKLTSNPFKDTPLEAFYAAGTAVWDSLNILMSSFNLVQGVINAFITNIPLLIPSWFGAIIITIIVLVLIFGLASAMLKWRV